MSLQKPVKMTGSPSAWKEYVESLCNSEHVFCCNSEKYTCIEGIEVGSGINLTQGPSTLMQRSRDC